MGYITSDHLIEYDAKIKQYIQTQITSATSSYRQQISALTATVADLTARLDALESSSTNNTTTSSTTAAPVLRSLSKGSTLLSVGNDNDSNDNDSGVSLRSIQPQTIVVQEDIQEDYVIYDRVISPNENAQYRNIVVTSDDRSNRIWFSIWKTFDDRSLKDGKEINIIWVNADGGKGESTATNVQIIDDRLYFAWDIPGLATYKAGTITYAIRIVSNVPGEEYAWHTLPATIECVQGLLDEHWDELEPAEETPGWVDYIEGKYKVALQIMDEDDYVALTDKSDEVLYIVNMNDDSINMYLGAKQISGGGGGTSANFVELTTQQYNALGDNIDPDTLYLLTD